MWESVPRQTFRLYNTNTSKPNMAFKSVARLMEITCINKVYNVSCRTSFLGRSPDVLSDCSKSTGEGDRVFENVVVRKRITHPFHLAQN